MQLIEPNIFAARLLVLCPIFEARVIPTIPDDDLAIDQHESPVAFVYLSGDSSTDQMSVGGQMIRQRNSGNLVVEIVVRRTATASDRWNQDASEVLKLCRSQVFDALVGWQPTGYTNAVRHTNGELLKKQPKVLKWLDTFNPEILFENGKTHGN